MNSFLEHALARKPLQLVREQAHLGDDNRYAPVPIHAAGAGEDTAEGGVAAAAAAREAPLRHMSLFDLVAFGVGCTVGSGVFVLAGVAAHTYAGPSSSLSYLLAGSVAALSGLPYAELAAAFPVDGSTYAYAYVTLGEAFAVVASLCQTLEYGGAGAAVARSWGLKVVDLVHEGRGADGGGAPLPTGVDAFLEPGASINPMAAIIAALCTLILLCGVQESKGVTNIISCTKVCLVLFMISAGFLLASGVLPDSDGIPASFSNWEPFAPMGPAGVVHGGSILFFAFLGFDQLCNMSGEAKNPVRDVPRAIVCTLLIDGVIYMLAALSLTALLPYDRISTVSGFASAFGANGWPWAQKLTVLGEIVVLPLVVLTSIQSQTRLMFAMAKDRLVPRFFCRLTFAKPHTSRCGGGEKVDTIGNLTANVWFCGVVIVLLAAFVPFAYLDSLISAGALFVFSLTDCCLLTLRYKCPSESFLGSARDLDDTASVFSIRTVRRELSLGRILLLLNAFPFISGLCYAFVPNEAWKYALTGVFALLTLAVATFIARCCPEQTATRFALNRDGYAVEGRPRFRTPFVPYLPALGIYMNWFMLASVDWQGIALLIGYLLVGVALYGAFYSGKSLVHASYVDGGDECGYRDQHTTIGGGSLGPQAGNQGLQQALLEEDCEDTNNGGIGGNVRNRGLKTQQSEIEQTSVNSRASLT